MERRAGICVLVVKQLTVGGHSHNSCSVCVCTLWVCVCVCVCVCVFVSHSCGYNES